jgi:hypothetical protein
MNISKLSPTIKVSSTLNRDAKSYGKKFLTDGSLETCWNSDKGTQQWISVELPEAHHINAICIMFQGGFAASKIEFVTSEGTTSFSGRDINLLQRFPLDVTTCAFKVVFSECTDFYGRITIYSFDIETCQ